MLLAEPLVARRAFENVVLTEGLAVDFASGDCFLFLDLHPTHDLMARAISHRIGDHRALVAEDLFSIDLAAAHELDVPFG